MEKREYSVRRMTRDEVDIAIEWAASEGWNPGVNDAGCFYAADPDGFLVGLLADEPVAVISVVKYGEAFAFLGLYIVKPEYRGQGHGIAIWNAGLETLGSRTVGLDGVVAQQDNYRRSGFVLAHRNVRYEGKGGGAPIVDPSIVRLSKDDLALIAAYDQPMFLAERDAFLDCWLSQTQATALGVLHDGQLAGYGVIRTCRKGMKIGPLFADSAELAERLFLALRAVAPTEIYLDVPAVNPAAVALAERHGMSVVFETARMYKGKAPELPLERIFGITTFELG